ncbi:MAG TPA: hypothetical protein VFO76_12865 [Candidatus Kapabacteria bacterium]|nr:hypothetical protein [Candidatus Kapabacteria bacterium]
MNVDEQVLQLPVTRLIETSGAENIDTIILSEWNTMQNFIMRTAIPIVSERRGRHEVIASGIVLTHNNRFFVITANHVLDERTQKPIGIHDGDHTVFAIKQLSDTIYHTVPKAEGETDNDDIGWFEISSSFFDRLAKTWIATRFEEQKTSTPMLSKWRVAAGYRGRQKSYDDILPPRCSLLTTNVLGDEQYGSFGLDTSKHILLSIGGLKTNGKGLELNELKWDGMSGGPIWEIPTIEQHILGNTKPIFRGIVTGGDKSGKVMFGTSSSLIWPEIVEHARRP